MLTMLSENTFTVSTVSIKIARKFFIASWLAVLFSFVFCLSFVSPIMPLDFSSEKEVKEYLEDIGIEYRVGCFSEKNPKACHLLGEYLEAIKKDYHKAARIYKSNCDDYNFPKSCHNYGNCLFIGQGVEKKNEDVAYEYFMKACSLGIGTSCFNAGMMALKPMPNQKLEKDFKKGIELLDKACTLENSNACYFLSGIFLTGSQNKDITVEKDMKAAFKYTEKACNLDHLYACMNLNLMYKRGEGVEKSEEMADKISKKVEDLKKQLKNQITIEFQTGSDST